MATHRIPIINWASLPDSTGSVFNAAYDEFATNDVWRRLIMVFADTATRIGFHGGFSIPKNYVGTPSIVVVWTSTAITGNVVWDFDYRAVGGNDTESLDQVGTQQSVTVTDAAPSAVHNMLEVSMSLTAGNLAVDDQVEFQFFRDGAAADTIAASTLLFELYFQYADV